MGKTTQTSRRSFLKSGALVAAPVAAIGVPVAALAADGSKAALTRLQDERAIDMLNRDFLRAFNQSGAKGTANLFAGRKAPKIAEGINRLSMDMAEVPKSFAIAADGTSAAARFECTVEMTEALEGQETIVQMARLQGNGAGTHSARKTLSAQYAKSGDDWLIANVEVA